MFEASKIIHQNNDWITLIFIFIFMVLTVLKVVYKKRLSNGLTFFISKKYLSIYYHKEKNKLLNLFQSLFFIVQLLVVSLIIYLANTYFHFQPKLLTFSGYILLFFGVALYFSLRYLIGLLFALLFDFKKEFRKIVYDKTNYLNNLILWILPFLVVSIYIPEQKKFLEFTFLVFILLLILRYSLLLINNKNLIYNNLFYFILYLCALEIAPLIIVLKLTI